MQLLYPADVEELGDVAVAVGVGVVGEEPAEDALGVSKCLCEKAS